MAQKRRFPVGGKEMDGVEVAFEPTKEPWSEYELADGGRVRIRPSVQRIFQLLNDDGKPARGPDGSRLLAIQSKNELVVQE
jgi:hypothetical protein